MWNELTQLALNIVRDDVRYSHETEDQLLRWALETGYPGAAHSHRLTPNLLYVYAASLLNSRAPGPAFDRFAEMVAAALTPLIVNNVIGDVKLPALARNCSVYLGTPGARPLTQNGTVNYLAQLQSMANGQRPPGILLRCLTSVIEFINLLRQNYGGSAATYHQAFADAWDRACPNSFVLAKYTEIATFKMIGVAVGMNFFKDSQVPGFLNPNQTLVDTYACNVGWFVKPDMHVLRLMLCATGRMTPAHINRHQLHNLPRGTALGNYANFAGWHHPYNRPYNLYLGRLRGESGNWHCIEDIHRIAAQEGRAPLGYDRLLYLIGSGRYRDPLNRLAMSQDERYRHFIDIFCSNCNGDQAGPDTRQMV